jgi:hypothetical protein
LAATPIAELAPLLAADQVASRQREPLAARPAAAVIVAPGRVERRPRVR